jgi:dolichol-phosphate mannosyltransferase
MTANSVTATSKTWAKTKSLNTSWQYPDFEIKELAPKRTRYCVCVFVINEGEKIQKQLAAMKQYAELADIIVADGGSKDGSLEGDVLPKNHVRTLLTKKGPGKLSAQMRMALAYALGEGYEGIIVVDGNNKDDVSAIPNFVAKLEEGFDHVQGSRFIPGGKAINTPLERVIGLHLIHAPLVSLASGKRHTDTTNGFRAYSARLIADDDISVFRDIFQTYELHYHLAIESSRDKRFKTTEVPVTRAYPAKGKTPTKISPIKGNAHVMGVLLKAVTGKYRKK